MNAGRNALAAGNCEQAEDCINQVLVQAAIFSPRYHPPT
jgi:hypothetical protein